MAFKITFPADTSAAPTFQREVDTLEEARNTVPGWATEYLPDAASMVITDQHGASVERWFRRADLWVREDT